MRMTVRISWIAVMWSWLNWIEICWCWRSILFVGRVCFSFVDIVGDWLRWLINVDATWWNLCWRLMMMVCSVCYVILVDGVSILGWWHFLYSQWIFLTWIIVCWLLIRVIVYLKEFKAQIKLLGKS